MDLFTDVRQMEQTENELRPLGVSAIILSLETQLKKEKEKNKRLSEYRNNARKHAGRLQRAYNDLRQACLEYDLEDSLKRSYRTIWFYASIIFLNAVGMIVGLFYGRF